MTTFEVSTAFGEGLHRERGLFAERAGWTRTQWLGRKKFLEHMIDEWIADGVDRAEKAGLQGRLMAVCLEGQTRFGD